MPENDYLVSCDHIEVFDQIVKYFLILSLKNRLRFLIGIRISYRKIIRQDRALRY
jgi:hypothetical protein